MADRGVLKVLDVWVPGIPKTKGSMDHIGRGRMRQSVRGSTEWAALVSEAVKRKVDSGAAMFVPRDTAVSVRLLFRMPGDDPVREQIGDVDKLVRNVLDALTGPLYADDVQVVRFPDVLRVASDRPAGCHIQAFALSPEYVRALTDGSEVTSWFAYREATDPTFRHAEGAPFGHDCMDSGCG